MASAAPAASPQGALYGKDLVDYIDSHAKAAGLDSRAVLAVVRAEGGTGGAIGDNGTSFGPFQLHIGGALPPKIAAQGSDYAQAWSQSPGGLDYAISRIQGVAGGQTGTTAISSIVSRFERPADPTSEIFKATSYYQESDSSWITKEVKALSQDRWYPGGKQGPLGQAGASIGSIGDALSFVFSYRFFEILGGGILIIIGLVGLMREIGVSVPTPAGKVADAVA